MADEVVSEAYHQRTAKLALADINIDTRKTDLNQDVANNKLKQDSKIVRPVEVGKENMKRSSSVQVSTRGRRRAEKKDTCCNGRSCQATSMRRCFSEAENSSSSHSHTSEETNDTTSSSSAERSENGSPSLELRESMEYPPSPTANLRMLFSAVSPEIRKMQSQRLEQQGDTASSSDHLAGESDVMSSQDRGDTASSTDHLAGESDVMSSQDSDQGKMLLHGSRKEKSLGLLCEKFLQQYPEYPDCTDQIEICLDEVAKALGVERRRIYDIVNVLESVEVVSRMAKNKYIWHGKTNLNTTLTRLKMMAIEKGFADQISRLKDKELTKELTTDSCPATPEREGEILTPGGPDEDLLGDIKQRGELRKDKSLGVMSQKFLMLFLVSKPQTVNLDMSAKILIGDQHLEKLETSKFKTKIRRLYDIANILTSLKLIKKVAVTEFRGRKPAFKYIGPNIDSLESSHAHLCYTDGWHRPSTRHSMLDCIRNNSSSLLVNNTFRPIRPALPTEGSRDVLKREMSDSSFSSAPAFSRHSSFEQFIAVVESELTRLHGYSSQPCSPIKKLNFDAEEPPAEPKRCNTDPAVESSSTLPQPVAPRIVVSTAPSVTVTAHNTVPVTATACRIGQKTSLVRVIPRTDTVIIKAKSFSGIGGNGKAPTVLPLTPTQIEGILQSFKHPVKTKQDASTQSSLDKAAGVAVKSTDILSPPVNMASMNELTPVSSTVSANALPILNGVSRKRCYIDFTVSGGEKRVKVDMTTPPSPNSLATRGGEKDETDSVNSAKPKAKSSSTRALTFMSDPQCSEPTITVCPAKPVATRPQSIQRITVQVGSQGRDGTNSSIFHLPLAQPDNRGGGKIVLTGLQTQSLVNQQAVMQGMPITCYVAPSTKQVQMVGTDPYLPSPGRATPVSSASHPSVHIVHPAATSSATQQIMVPMTFSPPLTPSDDPPAMFTFAGMAAAAPSCQAQTMSAFHVVQQTASSSIKVMPATPLASPAHHVQVFNVVAAPTTSLGSVSGTATSISCAGTTVLQAKTGSL